MIADIQKNWAEVEKRLMPEKKLLLLMDFDGTLSPIVPKPAEARLPRGMRAALKALSRSPRVTLAFLSGRPVTFLRRNFKAKGIYYGGQHGLEMVGPRLRFRHPWAAKRIPLMKNISEDSRLRLKGIPGAIVEDKKMSVSLHFRRVPPPRMDDFNKAILSLKSRTARWPLAWREGLKTWEILPRVPWNKGKAALWLYKNLGRPFPIAVGDDVTDEDMFRALRDVGLTVKIGRNDRSRARYYLENQRDVLAFLKSIESLVKPSAS